jgi:excisionase family DNA binding protein
MFSEAVEVSPEASGSRLSEDLLTPEQVAKRLRVSSRWVRDHVTRRSPRIPAVDLGSRMRFRPSDVEQFIRERTQRSSQKPRRV